MKNERSLLQRSLELIRAFRHTYEPNGRFPLIGELEDFLATPVEPPCEHQVLALDAKGHRCTKCGHFNAWGSSTPEPYVEDPQFDVGPPPPRWSYECAVCHGRCSSGVVRCFRTDCPDGKSNALNREASR